MGKDENQLPQNIEARNNENSSKYKNNLPLRLQKKLVQNKKLQNKIC